MIERTPNEQQQSLIEATDGVYVVDAGAGTGKTFTITRRYAALIDEPDLDPDDVLLITFTNNAAAEMKERVVAEGAYSMAELRDAPITTFHGWCHDLLQTHGINAPEHLGIDEPITASTNLLENEVIETDRFRTFLRKFVDDHPEHHDLYRVLWNPENLLGLIKRLAAKGVFPTATGWYRNGERYLDGDFDAFEELFESANQPKEGTNGPINSDLMNNLNGFERDHCLPPDAPSEFDLRGDPSQKRLDPSWAREAFDEDRTPLKAFIHDVYFEYISFALRRNYLNFSFLQLFAFVVLCDDHQLRESVAYRHVMVDEFQDTSEIQFKLALLLCETGNLCVVGDWKQSIYGFQYASVDNIRRFDERLETYVTELNEDHLRITFLIDEVETLPLSINYRSTQQILDFSRQTLTLRATATDEVDPSITDEITDLEAHTDREHSRIEAYTFEEELDGVLDRIVHMVGNDGYAVRGDDGRLRAPTFDDIAVLTRKRRFGRELQARADDVNIPVAYEGGVNLFETEQAILLLAWLRVLVDETSTRGWAVILEEAGYTLDEMRHLLDDGDIPEEMRLFADDLAERDTIAAVARAVFERYGFDDGYTDALIGVVQSTFDETLGNLGDLVRFFEQSIEAEATHEVSDTPGGDAVTVQTMHAAKGLQYPIVIVADINEHGFPTRGGGFGSRIRYTDPIGIRQTKHYRTDDRPYLYDNWRYRVLSACIASEYDEERRLFYVAMTRAEDHLVFTAGNAPSPFFDQLELTATELDIDLEPIDPPRPTQRQLQIAVPTRDAPIGQNPHTLMDDRVFEEVTDGRGTAFGNEVHEFAERYANGEDVALDPDEGYPDKHHVKAFIDSLASDLIIEEYAYLPITVNGRAVTISGIVDLVVRRENAIEIIDYKTDLADRAQDQYRVQLSIYYHVLDALYPDTPVVPQLFYTYRDERVEIDPLTIEEIETLVERRMDL